MKTEKNEKIENYGIKEYEREYNEEYIDDALIFLIVKNRNTVDPIYTINDYIFFFNRKGLKAIKKRNSCFLRRPNRKP